MQVSKLFSITPQHPPYRRDLTKSEDCKIIPITNSKAGVNDIDKKRMGYGAVAYDEDNVRDASLRDWLLCGLKSLDRLGRSVSNFILAFLELHIRARWLHSAPSSEALRWILRWYAELFRSIIPVIRVGYNTVWSELCECIRENSLQTVL